MQLVYIRNKHDAIRRYVNNKIGNVRIRECELFARLAIFSRSSLLRMSTIAAGLAIHLKVNEIYVCSFALNVKYDILGLGMWCVIICFFRVNMYFQ